MAIPYTKQVWTDNDLTKPTSAARMGAIESGILDAHFMPAVRVTHNANQSVASAGFAALAFNTERFDQASNVADTMHDTAVNNSRLTCRYAGVYQISGVAEWASNVTGVRQLGVRLNGATIIAVEWEAPALAGVMQQCVSTLYALAVNDYVELIANQNSGGGLNVNAVSNYSPEFMMVRVG